MRAFAPLSAILALAACTATAVPPAGFPPSGPPEDTCRSARYSGLIGQPASAVGVVGILDPYRVLTPGSVVTQDYSPARINIHVSASGTIEKLTCG